VGKKQFTYHASWAIKKQTRMSFVVMCNAFERGHLDNKGPLVPPWACIYLKNFFFMCYLTNNKPWKFFSMGERHLNLNKNLCFTTR
jgi:hypothetical protein